MASQCLRPSASIIRDMAPQFVARVCSRRIKEIGIQSQLRTFSVQLQYLKTDTGGVSQERWEKKKTQKNTTKKESLSLWVVTVSIGRLFRSLMVRREKENLRKSVLQ